jgi:alpha-1,2-mannosyltransferase
LSVATAVVVMIWLVTPLARARGWSRWAAVTIALALVAALDSVQQTMTFGQINLIMLALVGVDFLVFLPASGRLRRWGGTGIGLATAIKLTPGVFILYLLVTRRWRDSGVALATFIAASLVGLAVAPHESVVFWSKALWQTGRVGYPDYIFNQSLHGLVARLNPAHPSTLLWTLLVLVSIAFWVYAVRRAGDDLLAGFALTGILGCLISPVTWVHHLVFLIPALVWLVQAALASGLGTGRGRVLIGVAVLSYVVLISRVEELWRHHYGGIGGVLGGSAYLWASLLLLVTVGLATGPGQQPMAQGSTRNGITSENPAPSTWYAQQPGPETNVPECHSSGTPRSSNTTASPRRADAS